MMGHLKSYSGLRFDLYYHIQYCVIRPARNFMNGFDYILTTSLSFQKYLTGPNSRLSCSNPRPECERLVPRPKGISYQLQHIALKHG